MEQITRIEGWISPTVKQEGILMAFDPKKDDPAYNDMVRATLFISPDSTPPRVLTEEQVKAIWRDLEHDFRVLGKGMDIDQVSVVFTNHGITL